MEKIKVAVIGFGHLGKWHAQKVEASGLAKLHGIVELNASLRSAAQLSHPNAKAVESLDLIIDEIEAAVIVTPTSTHTSIVEILLKKNKHIFCEKPLCVGMGQGQTILNNHKSDLVFQVGHSERFSPCSDYILNQYKKKLNPLYIKINRLGVFKGRATDVDVVSDLMIHDIDLLLKLFGSLPEVKSVWGTLSLSTNWDTVTAQLEFGKHQVHVCVSRNYVRESREWSIFSEQGTHLIDFFNLQAIFAKAENLEVVSFEKRDHLLLEHMDFYQSILKDEKPKVSLQDGIDAVKVVEVILNKLKNK